MPTNHYFTRRQGAFKAGTSVCGVCVLALGTVVGGIAVAKAGGFGAAKTAIVTMMTNYVFRRR